MSLRSNVKIEADLLERAIDSSFQQLMIDNPRLSDQPNLGVIRAIYSHGFVAGSEYSLNRAEKLKDA